MKYFMSMLAVLALANPALADEVKAPRVLSSGQYEAKVKAIVCSGCVDYIREAMERVDGIDGVAVDAEKAAVLFSVKKGRSVKLSELQKSLNAAADRMKMGANYSLFQIQAVKKTAPPKAATPPTGRVEDKSRVCMTQDRVMEAEGLKVVVDGRPYWGCCEGCKGMIQADPARFTKAADPVSGAPVDKSEAQIYALDGRAYYFRTEKNLEAFAADPNKYLEASN